MMELTGNSMGFLKIQGYPSVTHPPRHWHIFSNKATPLNPSQTVPPNGDQAFKGILYGAIFIKTATSSRDTCPPGSLSLSTGADPKEFQSQVTQAGEQEDSNPDSKTL